MSLVSPPMPFYNVGCLSVDYKVHNNVQCAQLLVYLYTVYTCTFMFLCSVPALPVGVLSCSSRQSLGAGGSLIYCCLPIYKLQYLQSHVVGVCTNVHISTKYLMVDVMYFSACPRSVAAYMRYVCYVHVHTYLPSAWYSDMERIVLNSARLCHHHYLHQRHLCILHTHTHAYNVVITTYMQEINPFTRSVFADLLLCSFVSRS